MRIALYGPFLFELAVGLRENPANEVQLFLDENSLPRSLLDAPLVHDSNFVKIGPWASRRAIMRPRAAPITELLAGFDVILATELGPIFARQTGVQFFFIPTGWDLTCGPFPIRSRSIRPRGLGDLSAALVAVQLRSGIRAATGICGVPFRPFTLAAERLGCFLSNDLRQPIDTHAFSPKRELGEATDRFEGLTVFHPSRMMFTPDPFLIEVGRWKRNDIFLRGFAEAVASGVNARLLLIDRASSPDQDLAKCLIADLELCGAVEWLSSGVSSGFTWRELASLYRSADLVADEFGGWFGMVSLEGASCGKPVLNYVDSDVMALMHPAGHPFVQTQTPQQVCDAITMLVDPDRRVAIGSASREWILENHDRRVVARRCQLMLSELTEPTARLGRSN